MTQPFQRTLKVLAVLIVGVWMFPVYWVLLTSFKGTEDINTAQPVFVFHPTTANYHEIFGRFEFGHALGNSLVIVSVSTLVTMLLAVAAAYSLARLDVPRAESIALLILSFRFLPAVVVVLPYYLLFQNAGLIDTRLGLILVYIAFGLPFAVWILRGFLLDLPRELEEAARLDGLSRLRVMTKVILPLARPGIAVTAMFTFVFSWNEYLFSLVLTEYHATTVPVQISKMIDAYSVLWGDLSAAVVVQLVPMVVVVFLLQRHIVRGLALGAVK